jgi:hypothetical protein
VEVDGTKEGSNVIASSTVEVGLVRRCVVGVVPPPVFTIALEVMLEVILFGWAPEGIATGPAPPIVTRKVIDVRENITLRSNSRRDYTFPVFIYRSSMRIHRLVTVN